MSFARLLRVSALLTVLVVVAGTQWLDQRRAADWDHPLWITLYPVVTDGRDESMRYARGLVAADFEEINGFLVREARRHGLELTRPLEFQVAPVLADGPPPLPPQGKRLETAIWSLKMRWWAWRRSRLDGLPNADVQLFLVHHPVAEGSLLDRSVGVRKGMFGIVNTYANRGYAPRNRVVIAHELLHVLGASDKYEPATGQPIVPEGLADPRQSPLYPQTAAEIMGGRIARGPRSAVMPPSLARCVVGDLTAAEIGWLR